ncbi:hypothetical protein, partial [Tamlana crocina]|uniref:hypothetical protein n=1 Tax=Tamlana crocina TaxID=393006 RepID=UPI001ADD9821
FKEEVRKLYLSVLADGVSRNVTLDPSIWNIINDLMKQVLALTPQSTPLPMETVQILKNSVS